MLQVGHIVRYDPIMVAIGALPEFAPRFEDHVRETIADAPCGDRATTALGAESPLGRATRVYSEYQWDRAAGADRTTTHRQDRYRRRGQRKIS